MLPLVSVVIPVYNNQDTIIPLHQMIDSTLQHHSFEIIFVDDHSLDGSLNIAKSLSDQHDTINVLALSQNVGQNQAIIHGLQYVRGQSIVIMDADLQDPPEAIPLLLNQLATQSANAIFAGRTGNYSTWRKWLTSRGFKFLLSLMTGFRLPMNAGLFLAMDRLMLDKLLKIYQPQGYILSYIGRTRLPVQSVSVQRNTSQSSNYTSPMRRKLAKRAIYDLLGIKTQPASNEQVTITRFGYVRDK